METFIKEVSECAGGLSLCHKWGGFWECCLQPNHIPQLPLLLSPPTPQEPYLQGISSPRHLPKVGTATMPQILNHSQFPQAPPPPSGLCGGQARPSSQRACSDLGLENFVCSLLLAPKGFLQGSKGTLSICCWASPGLCAAVCCLQPPHPEGHTKPKTKRGHAALSSQE